MPRLLITDDDLHLRKLVRTYAELENYHCEEAASGREALDRLAEGDFDLVVLDIMMPGMDGFEALAELRKFSRVPVILLTARGEEYDKLFGFNLGADDYVSKPFSPKELMARVGAVLKRSGSIQTDQLRFGELTINAAARTALLGDTPMTLTPKEFDLLLVMAQNEHIVLSREQLLERVWGYDYFGDTRTVDTHIKSLREHMGAHRSMIQTVWGVGYKFAYKQEHRAIPFLSRMGTRLWLIMMVLALLSIVFMWVVQIFLFERNYINSAMGDVQSRLEPIMEDLKTEDLAYNDKLIPYLSKSTSGKMILLDQDGLLISMYSYGHPIELQVAESESSVYHNIKDSKEFEKLLQGEQYKKINRYDTKSSSIEIGIPVTYDGRQAFVVLYHSLDDVHTVLAFNRRQLVILSVILTLVASLLAAVFSRGFTKPIKAIKSAVDRLAKGDLSATPALKPNGELGQLSCSVEELGRALQRVDVLRKEVIANVSHELRSPLALIIGYGEMVRDISWKDEQERNENLNLIIQEAVRMSEMVNDIMDYSQFQAGYIKLKKERYNLYDVVESEITHCEQSAREHGITMRLQSPGQDIPVLVDALKISQVIRNLLYNAINHTENGETIAVAIERRKSGLRVSVANPGEPIPEAERSAIWERYHRSQHQGGRRQGTGLGLSIVSTILDAHGMAYGVDCKNGLTSFWFEYREK